DECEVAEPLIRCLTRARYTTDWATTLAAARHFLRIGTFDLALVDRRLPDGDGLEIIASVRQLPDPPRLILLTALGSCGDRVTGLDAGADDYLVKPFEPQELLARMRAVLRRNESLPERCKVAGALTFDPRQRQFFVRGTPIALRRREVSILEKLMTNPGTVVMREALEAATFAFDDEVSYGTLESHISRLRKRLRDHGAGITIHVIRGVGYMLQAES
ncbi:MAG TPA: response regulator transcription factor, partial [Steroidobacteraceae bacterium]